MPLVDLAASGVRVVRVERRILQPAGGIHVAGLAHVLEQHVVAWTPVEAKSLLQVFCRTVGVTGLAAAGVVDDAPGGKTVVALVAAQHAEPVDEHANTLLERIGVEAIVAGGRLEPDEPPDALGLVKSFAGAGFVVRCVLVGDRFFGRGAGCRGECGGGRWSRARQFAIGDGDSRGHPKTQQQSHQQDALHAFTPFKSKTEPIGSRTGARPTKWLNGRPGCASVFSACY